MVEKFSLGRGKTLENENLMSGLDLLSKKVIYKSKKLEVLGRCPFFETCLRKQILITHHHLAE